MIRDVDAMGGDTSRGNWEEDIAGKIRLDCFVSTLAEDSLEEPIRVANVEIESCFSFCLPSESLHPEMPLAFESTIGCEDEFFRESSSSNRNDVLDCFFSNVSGFELERRIPTCCSSSTRVLSSSRSDSESDMMARVLRFIRSTPVFGEDLFRSITGLSSFTSSVDNAELPLADGCVGAVSCNVSNSSLFASSGCSEGVEAELCL